MGEIVRITTGTVSGGRELMTGDPIDVVIEAHVTSTSECTDMRFTCPITGQEYAVSLEYYSLCDMAAVIDVIIKAMQETDSIPPATRSCVLPGGQDE